jgi:hypothetical protein
MSAIVHLDDFRKKPAAIKGTNPPPLMWQCKCGSQQFSFTEAGDVYCAGSCLRWMLNLRVTKT